MGPALQGWKQLECEEPETNNDHSTEYKYPEKAPAAGDTEDAVVEKQCAELCAREGPNGEPIESNLELNIY